jgi:hypothetical protein
MTPATCCVVAREQLLFRLLPRLQALGAEKQMFVNAIFDHADALYIRIPAALRMAHRMADIIPELWPLAATFTPGHRSPPEMLLTNW